MAKMMFLIVKRQWRQHHDCFTGLFAVCGHKANYLQDQVNHSSLAAQIRAESHDCFTGQFALSNGKQPFVDTRQTFSKIR